MINVHYLPPNDEGFYDQIARLYPEDTNRKVGTVTFQVTEDCCLACTYCYQHNKSNKKMNFNTAKILIDKLLHDEYSLLTTKNTNALILEFIGGEPFLEIDLIQQIVDYYFETAILLKHEWAYKTRISICSNGILYLNPKVQTFFDKYCPLISFCISIDGSKELHDSCRIDHYGQGSYDKAIASVKHYRENYNEYINTKMTLVPQNLNLFYTSIIDLIKNKYSIIHVNCAYENIWSLKDAKDLYEQLIKIGDYLINNNLYNKINVSMLKENTGEPMNEDENNNWCGGCVYDQSGFAIDPEGKIYSCIRYMDSSLNGKQKPLIIGDVDTGLFITIEEKENANKLSNITRRSQSTDECFYCPIASGCGWCSAYNYEETGDPNKRVTYICDMHKARSLANVYYWNKLYQYLKINKNKINYLSQEESIRIIGEKNYSQLLQIINN